MKKKHEADDDLACILYKQLVYTHKHAIVLLPEMEAHLCAHLRKRSKNLKL